MPTRESSFFPARDGTQLFSSTIRANPDKPARVGVVICHSFGEERQKAYRSTFLFSEILAKAGYDSFRFDYRGIGDSDGLLADTSVDQMVSDTVDAVRYAQQALGNDTVVLLGIRIGAAIAMRTAAKLAEIKHCIMWNPNIDGSRYLRELMRTEMIISLARKKDGADAGDNGAPEGMTEIDADFVTEEFITQMKSIDLLKEPITPQRILLTTRAKDKRELKDSQAFEEVASDQQRDIEIWNGGVNEYWSARRMHDGFFPHATFGHTMEWMDRQFGAES